MFLDGKPTRGALLRGYRQGPLAADRWEACSIVSAGAQDEARGLWLWTRDGVSGEAKRA